MKIAHSSTSSSDSNIRSSVLVRGMTVLFVLFLLLWIFPRFIPLDALCKRGLECALLYPEADAPFRANVSIHRNEVCGDLNALYGSDEFCVKRKENFETDNWGYRNSRDQKIEDARYVLLGDSFGFGQGLDQSEMPSTQISGSLGGAVYNGAGKLEIESILSLSRRAGYGKIFLYLDLDRAERNPNQLEQSSRSPFRKEYKTARDTFKNYNPLKILISRLGAATFGRLTPHSVSSTVSKIQISNQREFLFLNSSLHRGGMSEAWISNRVGYFQKLQATLRTSGQKLFVVLIPEKSSIYIDAERPRASDLDLLSDRLNAAGIDAVSLGKVFLKATLNDPNSNHLLYYADDTHWSREGVRLMAETLKADPKLLKNTGSDTKGSP